MANKRKVKKKITYTKAVMSVIVFTALFDMQLPFILALIGREQIAETLGGIIVTEIVGVFLVYCAKSFFETRESEKTRLKEHELGIDNVEETS